MLRFVIMLINLNLILINFGTKILCMIVKLKFTEPEAEVYIIRISYIGYQNFVSFVFVLLAEALACARNSSTSMSLLACINTCCGCHSDGMLSSCHGKMLEQSCSLKIDLVSCLCLFSTLIMSK